LRSVGQSVRQGFIGNVVRFEELLQALNRHIASETNSSRLAHR
jgi:hypothetical protein